MAAKSLSKFVNVFCFVKPMESTKFSTSKATIEKTESGHILIKIIEDTILDETDIAELNKLKEHITGENQPYTLIFVSPKNGIITEKARKLSASEKLNKYAIAKAIVVTSLTSKVLAQLFIQTDRPSSPTRTFSNIEEATEWLNQKRNEFFNK